MLYSPLTPQNVQEGQGPALLLQFMMTVLQLGPEAWKEEPKRPVSIVFSWTVRGTSRQKMQEYASLLPYAFPHFPQEIEAFYRGMEEGPFEELATLLHPFLLAVKESPSLIDFLFRYRKEELIGAINQAVFPDGIEKVKKRGKS
jgi:hypothetical protein